MGQDGRPRKGTTLELAQTMLVVTTRLPLQTLKPLQTPSPQNNANPCGGPGTANGVQRPNTAPVSVSEQNLLSSTLAPNLFDNLDYFVDRCMW
jgi:hypothetical protein